MTLKETYFVTPIYRFENLTEDQYEACAYRMIKVKKLLGSNNPKDHITYYGGESYRNAGKWYLVVMVDTSYQFPMEMEDVGKNKLEDHVEMIEHEIMGLIEELKEIIKKSES